MNNIWCDKYIVRLPPLACDATPQLKKQCVDK